MGDFTTRRLFLVPSFDPWEEDERILLAFLSMLEASGVGKTIDKYVKSGGPKGGRPGFRYHDLLAAILLAFAMGCDSVREVEDACKHDLRFIYLMQQERPDYSTFAKFITDVLVPNQEEIFSAVTSRIADEMGISPDDAFVDGTKYEANANKYKFVWKPTTFHERLSSKFFSLARGNGLIAGLRDERLVSSATIAKAVTELSRDDAKMASGEGKGLMRALSSMMVKAAEYEEKERICGPGRKSYYKTDRDATAMALKADYYSGLGSNMHAAYNVQILVCRGLVFSYSVTQSRNDISDFIGVIERFGRMYGKYPDNVCADAGYGSPDNYSYLKGKGIGCYVKHQSWEGNASGRMPDCWKMDPGGESITCLAGNKGRKTEIEGRHPKKKGSSFFVVKGCGDCRFKAYCMRFVKDYEGKDEKIFEANPDFAIIKQEVEESLLSPKGIELRVNRSIQVEGVFGIGKQNRGYVRLRRRGMKRSSGEIMLMLLGLNIRKYLRFLSTGRKPEFWTAPEGLEAQSFPKPSAKRLSKKGRKINERAYRKKQG